MREETIRTDQDILEWVELNPKKYYKNGKIYGLLAEKRVNNINFIYCMAKGLFTYNMIKDIICAYEKDIICLIVDTKSRHELIRRALSRYNFQFQYEDNFMYAIGEYNGRK